MSILPVITRELRSQARQPLTHLLRLGAALAICLAFWLAFSSTRANSRMATAQWGTAPQRQAQAEQFGLALFGKLNLTIFIAIWVLTPLAAADSISRERREGTLPLLQLTSLKPWEIVVGKSFVHMLRSASIFLTMAPWLVIPLLFGGVSVRDLQMALLLDSSALLLAGSAGILASTFSRDWLKSVLWAQLLAVIFFMMMTNTYSAVLKRAFHTGVAPAALGGWAPPPGYNWLYHLNYNPNAGMLSSQANLLALITNASVDYSWRRFGMGMPVAEPQSKWQQITSILTPPGNAVWFGGVAAMLIASLFFFFVAVAVAAAIVKATWRAEPQSARMSALRDKYFKPRYAVAALRKRLNRALDRNPIGWLHSYSPSARLTKWSWCLVLILVELAFATNPHDLYGAQMGLGFLLCLGVLFSSVGSFRNELENGAFELLLVTPIRERQILLGRVAGIWMQFLPAFVLHAAGALYLASGWTDEFIGMRAIDSTIHFGLLFVTAPFFGLFFSFTRWNFLLAWLAAAITANLFVFILPPATRLSLNEVVFIQLALAAVFAWRILSRLSDRVALAPGKV